MTRDVDGRSQNWRHIDKAGSLGAQLITGVAFVPIFMNFSNPKIGYPVAARIVDTIGVISFYICFRNTKEYVKVNRTCKLEKTSGKDYIKIVFTNRPLLCLILMTVFTISAMNTNNQISIIVKHYFSLT